MDLNEEILLNYISGECPGKQSEAIDKWLDESPDNASFLFGFELVLAHARKEYFENGAMVEAAEKKLMARIDRQEDAFRQEAAKRRRRNMVVRGISAAAAAAAIIVVGVMVFRDSFMAADMVSITVPPESQVKEITLPDGSTAWLNEGGRIEYAADFGSLTRSLYLEGEAYFEVAHDDTLPFVVKSPALCATVLGTTFNMKSGIADSIVAVTLISGSVEVSGNCNEGRVVLSPGQKAEIDIVSGQMTVRMVDAILDAVWHDNLIPFHDASILEIAKSLEQLYGVKISLSEDLKFDRRYSGVLHRQSSILEVLESLKNTIPITYHASCTEISISVREPKSHR